MKQILIIGAGAAGLCAARHSLGAGHEVVVFEQSDRLGGTWVYRDEVGVDENGLEIHSSMYKGLFSNIPKEIMCYPDVPMAEQPDSYIPAADVLTYLNTFADRFALRPHIRFNKQVIRVRPVGDQPTRWEVLVRDVLADDGRHETLHFEAVFVCNGHFSEPHIPPYPGRQEFVGNLMHSHAYRTPERFVERSVLVIGGGQSSFEVALECQKAGAARVAISHHRSLMGADELEAAGVGIRPAVERFDGADVVFVDGRHESYTDVIFCTGYKYTFPFLSADCGLWVEENAFVRPLYKECVNIAQTSMFVLGLPFRVIPFQVMDFQARFCVATLEANGGLLLPDRNEMLATTASEMRQRIELNGSDNVRHMHMLAMHQKEYCADLAQMIGQPPLKPYMLGIIEEMKNHRARNAISFRQQRFRVLNDEEFSMLSN